MGASKPLVRLTVRMRACCLSSLDDEMAIWLEGGDCDLTLLISTPPDGGGDAVRFDMVVVQWCLVKAQAGATVPLSQFNPCESWKLSFQSLKWSRVVCHLAFFIYSSTNDIFHGLLEHGRSYITGVLLLHFDMV